MKTISTFCFDFGYQHKSDHGDPQLVIYEFGSARSAMCYKNLALQKQITTSMEECRHVNFPTRRILQKELNLSRRKLGQFLWATLGNHLPGEKVHMAGISNSDGLPSLWDLTTWLLTPNVENCVKDHRMDAMLRRFTANQFKMAGREDTVISSASWYAPLVIDKVFFCHIARVVGCSLCPTTQLIQASEIGAIGSDDPEKKYIVKPTRETGARGIHVGTLEQLSSAMEDQEEEPFVIVQDIFEGSQVIEDGQAYQATGRMFASVIYDDEDNTVSLKLHGGYFKRAKVPYERDDISGEVIISESVSNIYSVQGFSDQEFVFMEAILQAELLPVFDYLNNNSLNDILLKMASGCDAWADYAREYSKDFLSSNLTLGQFNRWVDLGVAPVDLISDIFYIKTNPHSSFWTIFLDFNALLEESISDDFIHQLKEFIFVEQNNPLLLDEQAILTLLTQHIPIQMLATRIMELINEDALSTMSQDDQTLLLAIAKKVQPRLCDKSGDSINLEKFNQQVNALDDSVFLQHIDGMMKLQYIFATEQNEIRDHDDRFAKFQPVNWELLAAIAKKVIAYCRTQGQNPKFLMQYGNHLLNATAIFARNACLSGNTQLGLSFLSNAVSNAQGQPFFAKKFIHDNLYFVVESLKHFDALVLDDNQMAQVVQIKKNLCILVGNYGMDSIVYNNGLQKTISSYLLNLRSFSRQLDPDGSGSSSSFFHSSGSASFASSGANTNQHVSKP